MKATMMAPCWRKGGGGISGKEMKGTDGLRHWCGKFPNNRWPFQRDGQRRRWHRCCGIRWESSKRRKWMGRANERMNEWRIVGGRVREKHKFHLNISSKFKIPPAAAPQFFSWIKIIWTEKRKERWYRHFFVFFLHFPFKIFTHFLNLLVIFSVFPMETPGGGGMGSSKREEGIVGGGCNSLVWRDRTNDSAKKAGKKNTGTK